MNNLFGSRLRAVASRVLQVTMCLILASSATSHAQALVDGCLPANDLRYNNYGQVTDPSGNIILTTMMPVVWYPGKTFQVSIGGGFPVLAHPQNGPNGCPDVVMDARQWPNAPNPYEVGGLSQDVTLSNLTYVSPTLSTFTVSVSSSAQPGEHLFIEQFSQLGWVGYWDVSIENPPPPNPPSPPASPNCPAPTIASVTPSTWIAGKTYPITVTGTGFVTAANATDTCPVTVITVSVDTGTVTLSNVTVIDSTTVTATVTPADTDPEEPAEVILWAPYNVIDDDDDVEDDAYLTTQTGKNTPVANALGAGVPAGYMMAGEIPAQIRNLKVEITDTCNFVNGVVRVKFTGRQNL